MKNLKLNGQKLLPQQKKQKNNERIFVKIF